MAESIAGAPVKRISRKARAFRGARWPRALQHPAYRKVWAAAFVTLMSRFIEMTTTSWFVAEHSDTPLAITLAGFFRFLPFLVLGPFMGVIADRLPRIRIVRGAEAGILLSSLGVAALALAGRLEVWHLYVYTFIAGSMWISSMPARRAYMISTVGPSNMTSALALDMLGWTISNLVASNLAGNVLRVVQPGWMYAWVAVHSAVALALLRGLPALWRPRLRGTQASVVRSLAEGFSYVRQRRVLVAAVLLVALTNLTGFLFEMMTPVFAKEVLHTSSAGLGLLISAPAFGSLCIGMFLMVKVANIKRPGLGLIIASAAQHGLTILWSLTTWFPASFLVLLIIGLFSFMFGTMNSNTFLAATPDNMRGRVQGVQMFVIGTFPLSGLLVGWLANQMGAQEAVRWTAAAGGLALVLIWLAFPEIRQKVEPATGDR